MNLQFLSVLHSLPLLLATAGLLLIMGYVWRRADGPAVRVFLAFALATVLWLLCSVLASFSQDVTLFLFWIRLSLLGATTVPVVWLGFVWRYLDHPGHVLPRIVLGLLAFPLLTNLIAWTNDLHHLYWVTVEPVMTGDGLTGFNQVYGPWPLLQNLYVLVLLVLAGGLLVREFVRGGADRRQIGLLLLAWLLPLGTGLLTTASPSDSLDYALLPFVVAVSLVLTAWSVYNFGPLNVCPTAHNTVIESLEDGVLLIDRRNRITEVNPAATRLTGIAVEELVGQDVDALLSHWLPLAEDISGVWQGGELLVIRAGDGRRFLSMRQSAIRDQQGREDGRAIVLADVTARRAVEEDLRKFSRAVEQSASIAIITNTNGEIEYVNPRFTAITGYTLDDVRGENPRLLKSGETDDDTYSRLWGALSKGGQWQGELHNRKKNGDLYWVSATMSPIFDSRGNVTHFISIQEDVTARKEAEEAEREQRLLAESLRDTAAVLNSTLHLDEVLDRVLDNAERVISGPHDVANIMLLEEHTARVVRYREYVDHGLDPDEQLRVRLPIDRAHSLKTVIESGESFIIPDARDYPGWVETPSNTWVRSVITVPIRLQGEVIGFLDLNSTEPNAFTRDHAVKLQAFADQAAAAINNAQLFETVQRYADELVERNQELDSFSHTVAHDLRAPLHLIAGYANLIEISDPSTVPPDVVQFAREVVEAANKMADMIENLLLLATLRDTSQVIGAVEMEPVITSALRRYRRTIERRGFTIEVSPDLPPVMGHGPWLEEIFANLISNAIKYIGEDNAAPHIAIRARQEGGMARYEVQDNGIGISPENQQRLFEAFARFAQAEASGFGLGLSIVLRIVRKLSGQVGVESVPGEGSLFWVRLPAAQTISEPAAAPVES